MSLEIYFFYKMAINIYVEYPDKVEKFDICKEYGTDPELQLGEKPLPKIIDLKEIVKDFNFLLDFLPLEIWALIFKIIYKEELVKYKHLLGCDIEYNIHRLFKQKKYKEIYKGFDIEIFACPSPFQFYEKEYGDSEIKEYYGYFPYICHASEGIINQLSNFCQNFTKVKGPLEDLEKDDRFSICVEREKDFVFSAGFNIKRIKNTLKCQKKRRKICTFKTIPYLAGESKKIIDNFHDNTNRVHNRK